MLLDQVLEYVPVGIAMGRTRLSVCLRDVFVCEIWKTSCLPRIISNMVGLQVTVLKDIWAIRQWLGREMPRWAPLWAGLPRQIHCAPLLSYYDRRQ